MTVRTNVGQIASAIEAGRRAAASIDYGPIRDIPTISSINNRNVGDFGNAPTNPNAFIFGISKWGDTTLRVTH